MDVSLPNDSDQVVSHPDIFGPGRLWTRTHDILDLGVFPPKILDKDVSPSDILDMDASHPGRFAPGLLDLDVSLSEVSY